ncbi:MAG: amidohydrolase family protein [Acidimicrobiales bacterium]|nr:amidohydrolase family protein [Acidimicrobiales bacterium]
MSSRRLGVAAALVDGQLVPGDVTVADGRIVAVGRTPPGRRGLAVAGFVDAQINGFAGVDFTHAEPATARDALTALARHGVAWCAPTLPTAPPERYGPALAALSHLGGPGGGPGGPRTRSVGVHLEGPFLNPMRRGAHPELWLRPPDPEALRALFGHGPVAVLTLAPELPGAFELIAMARRHGAVVSLGHSEADADTAHRAFDLGASMLTHLWNAQVPVTGRAPSLPGAALARDDVHVGIIADLAHVAADTLRLSLAAAGRRAFVVTDALELAGLPPGRYERHGRVLHSDGTAIRLGDGTLAGSATTLDAALRNLVGLGVPLADAVDRVTRAPADALRRPDLGRLEPGGRADVTVLDDALQVVQVVLGGVAVHR